MFSASPRAARTFAAALLLLSALHAAHAADAANPDYLRGTAPDLTVLVAPPPAAGSLAAADDLRQVLALQQSRTPAQLALADGDTHKSVFRFADVVGSDFRAERLPFTEAFFKRLAKEGAGPLKAAKDYWKRPRPYNVSPEVHPGIVTEGTTPGYPSGHATFAYLSAVILATIVPEKRADIFARAEAYAQGRAIGGVHYVSDVEAGKVSGTVIAAAMLANPAFRDDLARATRETREALGLPALR
ncbi:Major phosphate-irrepressible acid phosphatase [Pandoraea pneumonica]|uniref:Acid phosphatase n=1 Tax=Pandoraea pneumonica TaxID=2508299 RepID=A0A5E4SJ88_9BURK|nr:phosphatase PAP2 family protein [Pandoraea pneumonica]VVD75073.1 Major phosphate-irrepressible acid phosphatase [Pandoraea pneumonica]